jgi:hypothetical protein
MKTATLLGIIVVSLSGWSASAMPLMPSSMKKQLEQHMSKKSKKLKAPTCVNLSGDWVGTCVNRADTTDVEDSTRTIFQKEGRCDEIEFSGINLTTNGVFSMQNQQNFNGSLTPIAFNSSIQWNDAGTKLYQAIQVSSQGMLFQGFWEIYLEGEELVSRSRPGYSITDVTGVNPGWTHYETDCRYQRVQKK